MTPRVRDAIPRDTVAMCKGRAVGRGEAWGKDADLDSLRPNFGGKDIINLKKTLRRIL